MPWHTVTFSALQFSSRVSTIFFLPGRAFCPGRERNVVRPMITVLPIVFSFKNLRSAGIWKSIPVPLPMPQFMSAQTIAFIFAPYIATGIFSVNS